MSPQSYDPTERSFRVRMRDQWFERLYLRAAELRLTPETLASQILERAVRRWKVAADPDSLDLQAENARLGALVKELQGLTIELTVENEQLKGLQRRKN